MSKVTFTTLATENGLPSILNTIFSKISDEFTDKVLYREAVDNETNTMATDLDMGENDIINVDTVYCSSLIVNGNGIIGAEGVTELLEQVESNTDRIDALEERQYITAVLSSTTSVPTTATVLIPDIVTRSNGMSIDTAGVLTISTPGLYTATIVLNIDCIISNTTLYTWKEYYDVATETWVAVPYTGLSRTYASTKETEITIVATFPVTETLNKYRLKIMASAENAINLLSSTVGPDNVVMPAMRLDIHD